MEAASHPRIFYPPPRCFHPISPLCPTEPPKPPRTDRYTRRNRPFRAPDTVVAIRRGARISPKKLNLIARLVRGMTAHDAVLQCSISDKKGGRLALELLRSALDNAQKKGLNVNQLIVGTWRMRGCVVVDSGVLLLIVVCCTFCF